MSSFANLSFNGAATFRLRKVRYLHGQVRGGRPFNGAATFRLRKAEFGRAVFRATGSFNGAATFRLRKGLGPAVLSVQDVPSMGPQPFGCGRIRALYPPVGNACLQWGRNLSVAEGYCLRCIGKMIKDLQWGRNLSVAEGSDAIASALRTNDLQWGRNLSVAEGATSSSPSS